MSQPDLLDHHWYVRDVSAMLPGVELGLQVLSGLQI